MKINEVYPGDVLEKLGELPDNEIDIAVTSPPYNKRNKTQGWLVSNTTYSHSEDHLPEDKYQAWQKDVLDEIYRVTKPGGSLFYNHKIRWDHGKMLHPFSWVSQSSWIVRQEIIWDRILAANVRGWRFWQVDERIYWLYKPVNNHLVGDELASKHAKQTSIWTLKPVPRSSDHPAPFPLEIPVRAIYSLAGGRVLTVLDPFCGTGTTLVAAKLLGHRYVGFDISPDYVEYARKRLLQADNEQLLVDEEIARHVVDDPFSERKKRGTVTWPFGPQNNHTQEKTTEEQILECLKGSGGLTAAELSGNVGWSVDTIRKYLRKLIAEGKAVKTLRGNQASVYTVPHELDEAEPQQRINF